jgi:CBS domain containing-hemolysin-like protein
MSLGLTVALVAALVGLNAWLVTAEYALVTVGRDRIVARKTAGGRRAKVLVRILDDLEPHIAAIRLCTVAITLTIGWVGIPAVQFALGRPLDAIGIGGNGLVAPISAIASFAFIAAVLMTVGESIPKRLGLGSSERVALWSAHFLRALANILSSPRKSLSLLARLFGRAIGVEGDDTDNRELRLVISQLGGLGRLSSSKRAFLENLLEFSNITAKQVMVPRDAISFLSLAKTLDQNLATIRSSGHTRYPLCERDIDSIVGMVHIKDLFQQAGGLAKLADLRRVRRKLPVVPETLSLDELQKVFEEQRAHMAQVVDEHGSIIGLVTLEDVLEQLVGEIHDEFDGDETPAIARNDDGLLVDGMMLVGELCRTLELDLEDGEADTVGGYVAESLGKIGRVGDSFQFGDFDGRVEEMEGRRISRVHLTPSLLPAAAASGDQALSLIQTDTRPNGR